MASGVGVVDVDERPALIEWFVHYETVELFVMALEDLEETRGVGTFPRCTLGGEDGQVDLGATALGDRLWPTEADYDSAEARPVHARTCAAVARVFALLATDAGRNYCATQAARFATLAGEADGA